MRHIRTAVFMLYLMTDYVKSYKDSYFYGWGLIGLVGISVAINITADAFSDSAKAKITAAGGSVNQI